MKRAGKELGMPDVRLFAFLIALQFLLGDGLYALKKSECNCAMKCGEPKAWLWEEICGMTGKN